MVQEINAKIRAILTNKPRANESKSEKLARELFTIPKRPKGKDIPHYDRPTKEGINHQADLLFLPTDKFGYKYLLIVVDIADWRCDGVPLKSKTASSILSGFKKIYESRKILKFPVKMQFDSGGEFEGGISDYFLKHKVIPKRSMTNQHSQTAFAERLNLKIGKIVGRLQTEKELEKGKTVKGWVDYLPAIFEELNKDADVNKVKMNEVNAKEKKDHDKLLKNAISTEKKADEAINKFGDDIKKKEPVEELKYNVPIFGEISKDILDEGDKVRVKLNRPLDVVSGKRLHGNFRATDIRFSKEIHTIDKVNILPNQVPTYFVSDIRDRAYPRHELLIVK